MKKNVLLLLSVLITTSVFSQKKISYPYDPGAAMREHNLDFEHQE